MAGFPNSFNPFPPAYASTYVPPPVMQPNTGTSAGGSNWIEHTSNDGRKYYFNAITQQTTWEKPTELKSQQELILTNCPWKEFKSQNGNCYYYNDQTKQSVWTKPQELIDTEIKANQAETSSLPAYLTNPILNNPNLSHTPHTPSTPNDASNTVAVSSGRPPEPSAIEQAMKATLMGYDNSKSDEIPMPEMSSYNSVIPIPPPPPPPIPTPAEQPIVLTEYKTRGEMAEGMRRLFRDCGVPGGATWEQALRMISGDPRFQLLRHFNEKKQIFNVYKTQRLKEEREEQRVKAKQSKEDLERFLLSHTDLHSTLSYKQVNELLSDSCEWTAVPDRDRREIFGDVMAELAKREREEAKSLRKRNIKVFGEILKEMPKLTYKTTWSTVQQMLLDNEKFTGDVELQSLDKEDALVCFEGYICLLEQQHDAGKEAERRRQKRVQRKHREAFIVLLDEIADHKLLTATSLWKNLYSHIQNDDRFDAMLAQRGSTPLDLFKFHVEKLKGRFPVEKKIIKEVLKHSGYIVDLNSTYAEFAAVVNKDDRSRGIDQGNLKMTFDTLSDKAQNRERERMRDDSRRQRKLEQAFCDMLMQSDFVRPEQTSWDDVRNKLGDHPAFKALSLESERIRVFKEFIISMEESSRGAASPSDSSRRRGRKEKRRDKSPSNHRSSLTESHSSKPTTRKLASPAPRYLSSEEDDGVAPHSDDNRSADSKLADASPSSSVKRKHKSKKSKHRSRPKSTKRSKPEVASKKSSSSKQKKSKEKRRPRHTKDDGEIEEGEAVDDEEEDEDNNNADASSVDSIKKDKKRHKRSRNIRKRHVSGDDLSDDGDKSKRRRH